MRLLINTVNPGCLIIVKINKNIMEKVAKNKSLKTAKIIYWISTGLLSLFLLSGAFFINSKIAIDAMHHLGVPEWFRWELSIGHIIGGLLIIIPVWPRLKEWTYAAMGIDYLGNYCIHFGGWSCSKFLSAFNFAGIINCILYFLS